MPTLGDDRHLETVKVVLYPCNRSHALKQDPLASDHEAHLESFKLVLYLCNRSLPWDPFASDPLASDLSPLARLM